MRSHRLFFALWPDPATSACLEQLQARVRGRKTHREDFHITLVFLGNQPADLLPVFKEMVARSGKADLMLSLDRLGYFRRNKIAWIGMKAPPPELFGLHDELRRELEAASILLPDYGEFKPHSTLARSADAPDEESFAPVTWRTRRMALAESLPAAHGAKYRMLL